jgi:hypothetical protein
MPDTEGSLDGSAHAGLKPCATLVIALCLALAPGTRASAQQEPPVFAPAPSAPEFLTRYDFHMSFASLVASESAPQAAPDPRFSWDTHFGGSADVVDYVAGRAGLTIDYQAVLGSEYRPFDPNQGNYMLEGFVSARLGATEIAVIFHHVSRHLSDRPKPFAVAWNEVGGRAMHQLALGTTTVDADLEGGHIVQHSYVDYTWRGEMHLLVRHPFSDRLGVFGHGSGQLVAVDETVAHRRTQTGGLVEAGVRLNGRAAALEVFAGYEKRVDADPLDRLSRHWGLAGFRLLSR